MATEPIKPYTPRELAEFLKKEAETEKQMMEKMKTLGVPLARMEERISKLEQAAAMLGVTQIWVEARSGPQTGGPPGGQN